MKTSNIQPGTKIRMSAKFLRSTGQLAGGEGRKTWTVLHVYRARGEAYPMLLVDEPSADPFRDYSDAERMNDPRLLWRRISSFNVSVVGKPDLS